MAAKENATETGTADTENESTTQPEAQIEGGILKSSKGHHGKPAKPRMSIRFADKGEKPADAAVALVPATVENRSPASKQQTQPALASHTAQEAASLLPILPSTTGQLRPPGGGQQTVPSNALTPGPTVPTASIERPPTTQAVAAWTKPQPVVSLPDDPNNYRLFVGNAELPPAPVVPLRQPRVAWQLPTPTSSPAWKPANAPYYDPNAVGNIHAQPATIVVPLVPLDRSPPPEEAVESPGCFADLLHSAPLAIVTITVVTAFFAVLLLMVFLGVYPLEEVSETSFTIQLTEPEQSTQTTPPNSTTPVTIQQLVTDDGSQEWRHDIENPERERRFHLPPSFQRERTTTERPLGPLRSPESSE